MENELKLAETTEKQLINDLQNGISQIDQMALVASQSNADHLKDLMVQQLIEIEKAEFLANVMIGLDKYRNILRDEISEHLKEKRFIEVKEKGNYISEIIQLRETDVPSMSDATPCIPEPNVEPERCRKENEIDDFEWGITTELEIQNEMKDHAVPSTQEVLATGVKKSNVSEQITSDWEMIKEYYNLQDDSSDDDVEIVEIAKTNVEPTGACFSNNADPKPTGDLMPPKILNKTRKKETFVRKTTTQGSNLSMVDRSEQNTSKRLRLQSSEKFVSNSAPHDRVNQDKVKREREKKINFTFKKKTASGLKNLPQFTH